MQMDGNNNPNGFQESCNLASLLPKKKQSSDIERLLTVKKMSPVQREVQKRFPESAFSQLGDRQAARWPPLDYDSSSSRMS